MTNMFLFSVTVALVEFVSPCRVARPVFFSAELGYFSSVAAGNNFFGLWLGRGQSFSACRYND